MSEAKPTYIKNNQRWATDTRKGPLTRPDGLAACKFVIALWKTLIYVCMEFKRVSLLSSTQFDESDVR